MQALGTETYIWKTKETKAKKSYELQHLKKSNSFHNHSKVE